MGEGVCVCVYMCVDLDLFRRCIYSVTYLPTHTHNKNSTNPEHLLATKEKPDLPFSLFPDPELNRQSLVYRIKGMYIYV